MNLRSGLTLKTLRRDSRNNEEFVERRRFQQEQRKYQQEQRKIEETIYQEDETKESEDTKLEKKIKNVFRKTKHLLYLNKCQKENKHSLSEKINTIMELYEVFRYNTDYLIQYFKKRSDKRFPQAIFNKGSELIEEIALSVRTRKEKELFEKCKDDIHFVMYLLDNYILRNN
jgi:signal recognition particle GTPase